MPAVRQLELQCTECSTHKSCQPTANAVAKQRKVRSLS